MITLATLDLSLVVPYDVLAIHTGLPLYQLIYRINGALRCDLSLSKEPLRIMGKRGTAVYPYYRCNSEQGSRVAVFSNKCRMVVERQEIPGLFSGHAKQEVVVNKTLISHYSDTDYVIKIESDYPRISVDECMYQLRKTPGVQTSFPIELSTFNNELLIID